MHHGHRTRPPYPNQAQHLPETRSSNFSQTPSPHPVPGSASSPIPTHSAQLARLRLIKQIPPYSTPRRVTILARAAGEVDLDYRFGQAGWPSRGECSLWFCSCRSRSTSPLPQNARWLSRRKRGVRRTHSGRARFPYQKNVLWMISTIGVAGPDYRSAVLDVVM